MRRYSDVAQVAEKPFASPEVARRLVGALRELNKRRDFASAEKKIADFFKEYSVNYKDTKYGPIVYHAIATTYAEKGRVEETMRILDEMKAKGI